MKGQSHWFNVDCIVVVNTNTQSSKQDKIKTVLYQHCIIVSMLDMDAAIQRSWYHFEVHFKDPLKSKLYICGIYSMCVSDVYASLLLKLDKINHVLPCASCLGASRTWQWKPSNIDKRTENSPKVEPSMKACSVDETDEREISSTPSSTGQRQRKKKKVWYNANTLNGIYWSYSLFIVQYKGGGGIVLLLLHI